MIEVYFSLYALYISQFLSFICNTFVMTVHSAMMVCEGRGKEDWPLFCSSELPSVMTYLDRLIV